MERDRKREIKGKISGRQWNNKRRKRRKNSVK